MASESTDLTAKSAGRNLWVGKQTDISTPAVLSTSAKSKDITSDTQASLMGSDDAGLFEELEDAGVCDGESGLSVSSL